MSIRLTSARQAILDELEGQFGGAAVPCGRGRRAGRGHSHTGTPAERRQSAFSRPPGLCRLAALQLLEHDEISIMHSLVPGDMACCSTRLHGSNQTERATHCGRRPERLGGLPGLTSGHPDAETGDEARSIHA